MAKKIGFIGQGWIGRNYADDFEARGFDVVRYALEEPYVHNKEKLADRDIVFVAVPTPTTASGFDASIVLGALESVPAGAIAVVKSTILPGTTEMLQDHFPDILVMHSPEFLTEANAAYDAAHPQRNIVGIPTEDDTYRAKAKSVLEVLPKAPFELVCQAREAELVKYCGNTFLYLKVVYVNMLYDLARKIGCSWETVRDAVAADPRIGTSHMNPVHSSGRGAGGHCFVKDFKAFADFYAAHVSEDGLSRKVLRDMQMKNIELLVSSGKDLDILEHVYGKEFTKSYANKE